MTDNTNDSGTTPDRSDDAAAFEVNDSGEATPPSTPPTVPPTDVPAAPSAPTAPPSNAVPVVAAPSQPAASVSPEPVVNASAENRPADNVPADSSPAANQTVAYPTDSDPTDAFGRPIETPTASSSAYAPNAVPQAYATADSYPTDAYPSQPFAAKTKESGRRKGSVALIAALAIGALVGGSSGAGITALMMNGQNNGVPVSQASGPSNVVVNNTKSVNQITAVAAKASPSVVTIDVSSSSAGGTGSGVILTDDGYVLTNTHVVTLDGAASDVKIEVKSNDGKLYAATLVGTDPISDLAVIKLTDASGLTPMTWGDSSELNVGDSAIAIGAPLGLSGTVTDGIVSALNRSITVASSAAPTSPDTTTPDEGQSQNPFFFDFPNQDGTPSQGSQAATASIALPVIQTDAAINPGNSGGALLNGSGELVGINVAIASAGSTTSSSAAGSIGVGFSIPSNFAKRISDEIIANGKATHGLLGASVKDASSSTSSTVGALISEVTSGGAAAKAGLAADDVITNFNGVPITDSIDLTAQVRVLPAGGSADLTYVRDGKSITVSVTVGELSS
ncbi:putative serine protease PepD [Cryobacterium flavum]|uniref:PDZ domain-containing protein n=1 Tax=Cryobacterium flavum TaxID=1424659 RepID=A0A4R8V6B9_9MICO|nr:MULTISPECIES: trypsin-like peptidase domain-containing protein [Cryobacterium]TFB76786.1 PDZ domain-containing protein [Cryobacterium flavum]SDO09978.1 putative serine protease PepD [Cryobacterium flavum]